VRMRAIVYMLALELFGEAAASRFPRCENVKGFGMSDAHCYALPLASDELYQYLLRSPAVSGYHRIAPISTARTTSFYRATFSNTSPRPSSALSKKRFAC
jgi:hypothetical protein